jgi:DNA helicase-2/ATP-dependent DNA helicase PcrA
MTDEEYDEILRLAFPRQPDPVIVPVKLERLTQTGGRAGTGLWGDPTVPKTGWDCHYVDDLETPSMICEMCEVQEIRYVHHLSHPSYPRELNVGCVCAGKLTGDEAYAKDLDAQMKRRAARFVTFKTKWKKSGPCKFFKRVRRTNITLYKDLDGWHFRLWHNINGDFYSEAISNPDNLLRSAFAAIDPLPTLTNQLHR